MGTRCSSKASIHAAQLRKRWRNQPQVKTCNPLVRSRKHHVLTTCLPTHRRPTPTDLRPAAHQQAAPCAPHPPCAPRRPARYASIGGPVGALSSTGIEKAALLVPRRRTLVHEGVTYTKVHMRPGRLSGAAAGNRCIMASFPSAGGLNGAGACRRGSRYEGLAGVSPVECHRV